MSDYLMLMPFEALLAEATRLKAENAELRAEREKQKKLAELNFNCGLRQGQSDAKHIFERAAKDKNEYLTENERLTNMLLEVEAERDALRAKADSWDKFVSLRSGNIQNICKYAEAYIAQYQDDGVNLDD